MDKKMVAKELVKLAVSLIDVEAKKETEQKRALVSLMAAEEYLAEAKEHIQYVLRLTDRNVESVTDLERSILTLEKMRKDLTSFTKITKEDVF